MSSDEGVDHGRRHFLTVATTVTGGVGAVLAAAPFVATLRPSARAQALGAAVEVDLAKLESGAMIAVEWRGQPIFIVHRTEAALVSLDGHDAELRDPDSNESSQPAQAKNSYRSLRPELLVLAGVCTHLGCAPSYRPEVAPADLGSDWRGGFFCPCHGSRFDLAGRVFEGVPAPKNLVVPPYRFLSDTIILIGDQAGAG